MKRFLSPDMLAVYIAAVAIILSQLPPVYEFFQRPKPAVTADGWLAITHALGRPQVFVPITISNDGSATLTVESASCTLKHKESGKLWSMKVVSYVDQSSVQQFAPAREIPFGRLRILHDNRWSETVHCALNPTAIQLREFQQISLKMNDYINAIPFDPNVRERKELPESLWLPAKGMFEEAFDLDTGSYTIEISLMTDSEISSRYISSEFILEEEDMALLTRHNDEYKYGAGVMFPVNNALIVNKVLK